MTLPHNQFTKFIPGKQTPPITDEHTLPPPCCSGVMETHECLPPGPKWDGFVTLLCVTSTRMTELFFSRRDGSNLPNQKYVWVYLRCEFFFANITQHCTKDRVERGCDECNSPGACAGGLSTSQLNIHHTNWQQKSKHNVVSCHSCVRQWHQEKGRECREGRKGDGAALIVTTPGYCSHSFACNPPPRGFFIFISWHVSYSWDGPFFFYICGWMKVRKETVTEWSCVGLPLTKPAEHPDI